MQLWTYEHAVTLLPATVLMLVAAYLLRAWLRSKPMHIRMIPIQVVAVLLLLLEVGKQVLSLIRGYDLYHIPLHFCSLFIFMMPALAFCPEKYRDRICGITGSLCVSVLLMMLIYPSLIYSDGNIREYFRDFFSFHTVTFHNLVMFAAILIPALGIHQDVKGEYRGIIWFTLGFCLISSVMAQVLKTNFNNFYSCNIAPLESVRAQLQGVLGYGFTQVLYVLIVTCLNIGFVQGSFRLYLLLDKLAGHTPAAKIAYKKAAV